MKWTPIHTRYPKLNKALSITLSVLAYCYLAYLLLTYDDYASLAAHFTNASWQMLTCLVVAVALMPVNILFEACKWQCLLRHTVSLSLKEALWQVIKGLQGAFLTPGRLGEYPARVTRISDTSLWPKAIALGFVGSAALTAVNLSGGLIALVLSSVTLAGLSTTGVIIAALILIALCVLVLMLVMKEMTLPVLLWSIARYLVFSVQFMLVLLFVGLPVSISDMVQLIPIYYMVISVLPVVPAADPALKGSAAALVFAGSTSCLPSVALAVLIMWLINTILPMLFSGNTYSRSSKNH